MKAAATLRAAKVMGPYYAVIHPAAAFYIKKQMSVTSPWDGGPTNVPALSPSGANLQMSGVIGRIGGVTVVESPLVAAVTTGGANAFKNGVFAPTAIGIAERGGLSLNTLYLPANRATDLSVVATMGAAVLQSTHGVAITAESDID